VIGVEMVQDAINDAKVNAELNGKKLLIMKRY
jgi:tRNA/tmRNA/rRNA uracil-C5-methylase (TrmA/RlmC/RlmD family)